MDYGDLQYDNNLNKASEDALYNDSTYNNESDILESDESAQTISTPSSSSDPLDTTDDTTPITSVSKLTSGVFQAAEFIVEASGRIRSGQTAYDTGIGWWIGDVVGTKKLSIGNSAGNKLTWDGTTLSISGSLVAGDISIGTSPNWFRVDSSGNTWWGAVLFANAPASVTPAGVCLFQSGIIAGWTLSATAFSTGAFDTINTMYFGTSGLSLSNVFKVTSAGALTASSGVIGGFTITATSLYGSTIKTAATVGAGSTGVIMDTAGLRGYDSVLGNTFNLPTDGSAPTFSSGVINETIFEISTNAILRTSSTVGDGTANSAGILINSTGLYGCAANQTPSTANVRVLIGGTAVFSGSVKGGQTDFNTGVGYFIGLSGGNYKFSVGDPASNCITWDATYLRIKGNLELTSVFTNISYTVANLPIPPQTVGFNSPSGID